MSDKAPTKAQAAKACNVTTDAVADVRADATGPADRPFLVTLRTGSQIYIAAPAEPAPKPAKAKSKAKSDD